MTSAVSAFEDHTCRGRRDVRTCRRSAVPVRLRRKVSRRAVAGGLCDVIGHGFGTGDGQFVGARDIGDRDAGVAGHVGLAASWCRRSRHGPPRARGASRWRGPRDRHVAPQTRLATGAATALLGRFGAPSFSDTHGRDAGGAVPTAAGRYGTVTISAVIRGCAQLRFATNWRRALPSQASPQAAGAVRWRLAPWRLRRSGTEGVRRQGVLVWPFPARDRRTDRPVLLCRAEHPRPRRRVAPPSRRHPDRRTIRRTISTPGLIVLTGVPARKMKPFRWRLCRTRHAAQSMLGRTRVAAERLRAPSAWSRRSRRGGKREIGQHGGVHGSPQQGSLDCSQQCCPSPSRTHRSG